MNAATQLMNFPLTLQWLENGGLDPEIRKWQEELDKLHTKNLCQSLEDGIFFSDRSKFSVQVPLKKLNAMLADLKTGSFQAGIENLLRQALSKRTFDRGCEMDQSFCNFYQSFQNGLKNYQSSRG